MAQWMFLGAYLTTLAVVLGLYRLARPSYMPPVACFLLMVSKRAHSIYMLRLFNDCWAMLFLYVAVAMFCMAAQAKWRPLWTFGCLSYSFAVAIKMNIFLFAPALALFLLLEGGLPFAVGNIAVCAVLQLVVGAPFLLENPVGYIRGAFGGFGDLKHKWTVNWKFLPEDIFLSRGITFLLLGITLATWAALFLKKWSSKDERHQLMQGIPGSLTAERVLSTMLVCNFVAVAFSRSLHFQFYCWYFHALPLLLWRATILPVFVKFGIFIALEYAWSYGLADDTSTWQSSVALQGAHMVILLGLWLSPNPTESKQKEAID